MSEERDEKDLTGDLAVDDESAGEVTGGRESAGMTHEFEDSQEFKHQQFKHAWTKHWHRHA
jgi:hypothetical protein